MRRVSAVDGDVAARRALLEEDLKRTDKIMMLEKVHPDKIEGLKMKMNIIGSFFYNGLSSSGPPGFDNEDIDVPHAGGVYDRSEDRVDENGEEEEDDEEEVEVDDDFEGMEFSDSNRKQEL